MTLLQRSDQTWKIVVFTILLILGSAAALLQGFLRQPFGAEVAMQVGIGGMAALVGAFLWAATSIVCPKCQLKLFFHALRREGFFAWFAWLLQVEACPRCAYGETPPAAPRRKKVKGFRR